MITVRIPLAQQYAYIEATFDSTVEVNEQDLYDLVARLDDAAPKADVRQPAYTPRDDSDRAPAERRAPARQGQGSGLFCPDHPRIQLIQSAAQYQEWDEGPDGEKVPAKFFCPGKENGTGRNHSVWRSRALTAEPF